MKLEINFPIFDGFYHSVFDDIFEVSDDLESYGDVSQSEYDLIDWKKVHHSIGAGFISEVESYYKKELLSFGINSLNFVSVDSPKYYNYSTDKLVCNIDFNRNTFKSTVLEFIKENYSDFETFVKDNYSSYDGFISFYSNDAAVWLNDYIKKITTDNCIFEGFLLFILEHSIQFDNEYINDKILCNIHEHLHFTELTENE